MREMSVGREKSASQTEFVHEREQPKDVWEMKAYYIRRP